MIAPSLADIRGEIARREMVDDGGYEAWLMRRFPHIAEYPLAEHHHECWRWFAALTPGVRPVPKVFLFGRGGAKSSTAELGSVFAGVTGKRKFALYVSGTQDQADLHVGAIATAFEHIGVERAINKYGSSKGWRRQQIRTANGFNVAAYGLDAASRGIKLDNYRPDLIIFDDVDDRDDSLMTVAKKEAAITSKIMPSGSSDVAFLFIQNLIHSEGVFARLADGRADFLRDRAPALVVPAIYDLEYETFREDADPFDKYRIIAGRASWAGQSLEVCERQINDWGLETFLREAQHDVSAGDGYFFDVSRLDAEDSLPENLNGWTFCLAVDFAATQGGGDYTAFALMARASDGSYWVLDVFREQVSTDNALSALKMWLVRIREQYGYFRLRLPQDPGSAGVFQRDAIRKWLSEFFDLSWVIFKPVTGSKPVRARKYSEVLNTGGVKLLRGEWNRAFKEEHRKFAEDDSHQYDDQVDAATDAFNELYIPAVKSGEFF